MSKAASLLKRLALARLRMVVLTIPIAFVIGIGVEIAHFVATGMP